MDDEAKLVQEARQGSEKAFSEIVRLHQARVRTYLHRFVRSRDLVDDLAQETFLSVYRGLATFEGEAPLNAWLLSLARNHALMYLRGEQRRRQREGRKMASLLADALARDLEGRPVAGDGHDEEVKALEECVGRLPRTSARLIVDYYFKGQTGVDLARELGKSQGTVWSLLLRIRLALRACIEERLKPKEVLP